MDKECTELRYFHKIKENTAMAIFSFTDQGHPNPIAKLKRTKANHN